MLVDRLAPFGGISLCGLATLFAGALLIAGCGSDAQSGDDGAGPTEPTTIRCLFSDACEQLTGALTSADLASLEGLCGGAGGSYAVETCPTVATVPGHCATTGLGPSSGVSMEVATHYAPPWDATTAPDDCKDRGGSWVGGTSSCGDGSVTGAEVCDGANLGGEDCASQGFTSGVLACAADCLTLDASACTGETFTPTSGTEQEANGTIATANGPYTTDHLIGASIGVANDQDYFAIQNDTGGALTVRVQTNIGGVGTCGTGDTVLIIQDALGAEITRDDDGAPLGLCSLLHVTIPAGTAYYALVNEYWNDGVIVAYQLEVDFP